MTEQILKPCPFCGRQPHWGEAGALECDCGVKMEAWVLAGNIGDLIMVWGNNPQSSIESCADVAKRTIERWNRRQI